MRAFFASCISGVCGSVKHEAEINPGSRMHRQTEQQDLKGKTPVLSPESRRSLSAEEGRKQRMREEALRLPPGGEGEDNLQGDTHTHTRLLDASFR